MPTVSAILLINVETGKEIEVVNKLRVFPQIKYAFLVSGVYDIVAKVEVDSLDSLRKFKSMQIDSIKDIRSMMTMIVVKKYNK